MYKHNHCTAHGKVLQLSVPARLIYQHGTQMLYMLQDILRQTGHTKFTHFRTSHA